MTHCSRMPGNIYTLHMFSVFPTHGTHKALPRTIRPFGTTALISRVLLFRYFFQPLDVVPILFFSHGNMGHGNAGSGSVPVFDVWREPDRIARTDLLNRPPLHLNPADPSRDDQSLPQRMGMPCRTGSRLESDVSA